MRKFKIITLGCRVNQAESEAIAGRLTAAQWEPADSNEAADLCIINTCAVTQKAAMQSRQAIRRAIHGNPAACVAATGCYAETDPRALMRIRGLDYLCHQRDKLRLAEILASCGRAQCSQAAPLDSPIPAPGRRQRAGADDDLPPWVGLPGTLSSRPDAVPAELSSNSPTAADRPGPFPALPTAGARSRPLLKIQDGCDAFCSYCIVPYARGPSRSAAFQTVLDAVSRLAAQGHQEAVLTGIHLGNYGKDLEPRTSLLELLLAILQLPHAIRIRLSSIEPLELNDAVIDVAAGSERICRHFHIPLQSGDPQVLQRMRRPYTPAIFSDRVARIHERIPEAAIGADVLVGFPGETDAAFENTYALVERLPLTYLHVFPFSARPGTDAYAFSDHVPPERIRQRCARMRQLGSRKRLAFHRRFIGRRVQVLTESRRDSQTGLLKGVSSNYLTVLFEGGDEWIHRWAGVHISRADIGRLHGSLTG